MIRNLRSDQQLDARLKEIAEALGIPVSAFHEDEAPLLASGTFDLVRLYAAITDTQGRQRVVNLARREVARCRATRGL